MQLADKAPKLACPEIARLTVFSGFDPPGLVKGVMRTTMGSLRVPGLSLIQQPRQCAHVRCACLGGVLTHRETL